VKKSIVHITDHALLRYIERVLEQDVERLRRQIGREIDARLVDGLGKPRSVTVSGAIFRLTGKTVTTCIPTKRPVDHHKKGARQK
jgi:hypothetical protein